MESNETFGDIVLGPLQDDWPNISTYWVSGNPFCYTWKDGEPVVSTANTYRKAYNRLKIMIKEGWRQYE